VFIEPSNGAKLVAFENFGLIEPSTGAELQPSGQSLTRFSLLNHRWDDEIHY
jgi:hypothetical protein